MVESRTRRDRRSYVTAAARASSALLALASCVACTPADEPDRPPLVPDGPAFGYLDTATPRTIRSTADRISGWALDPEGVARVDLVAGDGTR